MGGAVWGYGAEVRTMGLYVCARSGVFSLSERGKGKSIRDRRRVVPVPQV